MSADRPDDLDDVPPRLPHEPEDPQLRADFGEGPDDRRPLPPSPRPAGFGFWMAALWTLVYFLVTQVAAGLVFTVLIFGVAMAPELREHGIDALQPDRLNPWMQGPTGAAATLCVVACTQFAGLALSWLLLRVLAGRWWKHRIALTRGPSATHLALVLIGMPALLALGAAVEIPIHKYVPSLHEVLENFGVRLPGLEGTDEMLGKLIGQSPWALALFVVGVTPAICEEVFCRGFLAWGLAHRYRTWAVVLIVSFLFGLLHGDPRQGLGAMLLGAAIHGSYLATRSLWVPMLVHWANNSLAVVHYHPKLFPVFEPYERLLQAPTVSAVLFVLTATAFFAAVCYALYQTRSKLVTADPSAPAWRPPSLSGMELPPPGSGTVVSHDRLSPLSVALVLTGAVAFGLVVALA